MSPSAVYYEIARVIRTQDIQAAPIDHKWEELLYRLAKMDDPKTREYGIRELNNITDGRQSHSHN